MSKKLLFAIMAVVLCVGLVGGAFSYFTTKVPDTNNVLTAGTLSMQISNDGTYFTIASRPALTSRSWLRESNTLLIQSI